MKKLFLVLLMVGLALQSFGKTFDELSKELLPSPEKLKNVSRDEQIKLTADGFSKLLIRMFEKDILDEKVIMPISQLKSFSPHIRKEFDTVFDKMVEDLDDLELTENRVSLITAFGSVLGKHDELLILFNKLNQDDKNIAFTEIMYPVLKRFLLDEKQFKVCSKFIKSPKLEFKKIVNDYNWAIKNSKTEYEKLKKNGGRFAEMVFGYKHTDKVKLDERSKAIGRLLELESIYNASDRVGESVKLRALFVKEFGDACIKEFQHVEMMLTKPVKVDENCFVEFREVVNKASDDSEVVKFVDNREAALNLSKTVHVSSKDIDKCQPTIGYSKDYLVNIRFTTEGAKKFGKLTEKIVGRRLAIVINGKIMSAPTVNEAIYGGSAQITGGFTLEEARNLAASINVNCGENFKDLKDKTKK